MGALSKNIYVSHWKNEKSIVLPIESRLVSDVSHKLFVQKAAQRLEDYMKKDLKIVTPRSLGIKRKLAVCAAGIYYRVLTCVPVAVLAKGKDNGTTDTGVSDVTDGIDVIKDLVLGCLGGVGVIFLAWGLLDFGTAYAAHETTQQSQAIKKVVGGLIMVAVPAILKLLGIS